MPIQKKLLIAAITILALTYAGGYSWHLHLSSELDRLQAECENMPPFKPRDLFSQNVEKRGDGPWEKYAQDSEEYAPRLCEPRELMNQAGLVGIQADIKRAYWDKRHFNDDDLLLFVVIAGLLALPWAWYFLLARIRELHNAIMGK